MTLNTRHRACTRALCTLVCILSIAACVAQTASDTTPAPKPSPQNTQPLSVDRENTETEETPEEDTTGKRAGGEEGRFGDLDRDAAESNIPKVDGEMVDGIKAKDLGPNKALGSKTLGSGPLKDIFSRDTHFDKKMNIAMSGSREGDSIVVGRGAGGMGMRGTGAVGHSYGIGTHGNGSIHGMGKVDTGGGRSVSETLRKKSPPKAKIKIKGKSVPTRGPAKKPAESKNNTFKHNPINPFIRTEQDALSTFAVDVDTAAYSISRSHIQRGQQVPPTAVRVEEFINAFTYDYKAPQNNDTPFAVHFDGAPSPFATDSHFVRIGLQGKRINESQRKPAHLTFLIDVSGSMSSLEKLGMAKKALTLLTQNLRPQDTVAISTYAGRVAQILPPTSARHKTTIIRSLKSLDAGGSTAMSDGLELAYNLASKSFQKGHINRVIVLSDGDANVGATSHEQILKRISKYTKQGITLSTIGFGYRGYNDHMMEQLANKGNGNYYFIDSLKEAKKVFVRNLTGTLQVIAKDVKTQVEFNPQEVASYRLIGYENRDIADKDFRNDKVDAGEIGAGHQVTAIYEIRLRNAQPSQHIATVRLRHKTPTGTQATESKTYLTAQHIKPSYKNTSTSYKLAFSSMAFAEKLRNSPHAESWDWNIILSNTPTRGTAKPKEAMELRSLIQRSERRGTIAKHTKTHFKLN